jgi:hypothetical protein
LKPRVTAFRGRGDRGFVSVRTHTSAQADTNLGFRHVDKGVSSSAELSLN